MRSEDTKMCEDEEWGEGEDGDATDTIQGEQASDRSRSQGCDPAEKTRV